MIIIVWQTVYQALQLSRHTSIHELGVDINIFSGIAGGVMCKHIGPGKSIKYNIQRGNSKHFEEYLTGLFVEH